MTEIKLFDAQTDRQARSFVSATRQPDECFATFRGEANENGYLYRAVPLDIDRVETLAETRASGSDDPIEAYAATFAEVGETLVGVN